MDKDLLLKSIIRDGEFIKVVIATEECSELQHTLCKYLRGHGISKDSLYHDVADLIICIENLKIIFDLDHKKLDKTIENIIKKEAAKHE